MTKQSEYIHSGSVRLSDGTEVVCKDRLLGKKLAAAEELYAACKALLEAAHQNGVTGFWSIGPMDKSVGGKLDMLQRALDKVDKWPE